MTTFNEKLHCSYNNYVIVNDNKCVLFFIALDQK